MFDNGTLFICDKTDISQNGDMPREALKKKNKYWFERRTIGINRSYLAKGANERVDLVVRVQGLQDISIHQYAVLGNGDQYRIIMVSQGHDSWQYTRQYKDDFVNGYRSPQIIGLEYTELTLMKLEKNYELAIEKNKGRAC